MSYKSIFGLIRFSIKRDLGPPEGGEVGDLSSALNLVAHQ